MTQREKNKEIKRTSIIETAEELFGEVGYKKTSMDEIAKRSHTTKRTVYQYFTNKGDLFFAIALKGFKLLLEYTTEMIEDKESGYEKICESSNAYLRFYNTHPRLFLLVAQVGEIQNEVRDSPYHDEWILFQKNLFTDFVSIIQLGKDDGSIRADFELPSGAYSIAFLRAGFLQFIARNGASLLKEFDLEREQFIKSSIDLIYRSLKA